MNRKHLFLMLIPTIIAFFVVFFIPIGYLFNYSFLNYELTDPLGIKFIGLKNYFRIFSDKEFWNSLRITIIFLIVGIGIQVPIALLLGEILSGPLKRLQFLRSLFLPPMVVPPVVAGVMFRIMYHPTIGIINYFLSFLGISHPWLANNKTALFSVIMVDVWQYVPFLLILFLAGFSSIPEEVYESAMIDGANRWQTFIKISLPLIKGSLLLGLLFRVIDILKVFPTIHIMTAGGPGRATETVNYYTYRMAFSYTNIGYASALGVALVIITILLSLIMLRFFRQARVNQ
ncbi:carbohydrate ABC transporter permease [Atribacter laminatus]|uniref:Trehalose transport system permease protein SugA n=1 Tax=Atribacter laminatus TaxID=2847778 RepID=A0A7T1AND9_ATRLM|nr:sugar ABC transporter permease [Atribacter laminatus]QPM69110.1 Trehalose transport system permease protein SugA [Atribacter laminatus]